MTRPSKGHAPATSPYVLLFGLPVTLGADKLVDVADGLCCFPQLNRPREQRQRRTTLQPSHTVSLPGSLQEWYSQGIGQETHHVDEWCSQGLMGAKLSPDRQLPLTLNHSFENAEPGTPHYLTLLASGTQDSISGESLLWPVSQGHATERP